MFMIDTGNEGATGPFLMWSARGTNCGTIPPKSFYVRDEAGKTFYDASHGFVLDIENMKTGWQKSEGIKGVAPTWHWNKSVSQMMPSPGEDYKKGFSVHCALGNGASAYWEQSGAAVWNCLTSLASDLAGQPAPGMLPLVRLVSTRVENFKKGSTVIPEIEIVKWVDRPACLKEGAVAGIASEPVFQQEQVTRPSPQISATIHDAEF